MADNDGPRPRNGSSEDRMRSGSEAYNDFERFIIDTKAELISSGKELKSPLPSITPIDSPSHIERSPSVTVERFARAAVEAEREEISNELADCKRTIAVRDETIKDLMRQVEETHGQLEQERTNGKHRTNELQAELSEARAVSKLGNAEMRTEMEKLRSDNEILKRNLNEMEDESFRLKVDLSNMAKQSLMKQTELEGMVKMLTRDVEDSKGVREELQAEVESLRREVERKAQVDKWMDERSTASPRLAKTNKTGPESLEPLAPVQNTNSDGSSEHH